MRYALIALVVAGNTCWAGGTLDQSELIPLLGQKPQIKEFVLQNFDMPTGAWAEVRIGSHFEHLGGRRLGPYTVEIRTKGSSTMSPVVLTLCTTYEFLDRDGKRISPESPRVTGAVDVRESLVDVRLTEARETGSRPACS